MLKEISTGTPLTPKYLTRDLASEVVDMVLQGTLFSAHNRYFRHQLCHIVVLVPALEQEPSERAAFPSPPPRPFPLYELSVGNRAKWPRPYDKIARNKAEQLWYDRNADGQTDSVAHLLYSGDTAFWGGVKRHSIVVACSGVQPWFDQMISGMIADGLKAFGRNALELDIERTTSSSAFLS